MDDDLARRDKHTLRTELRTVKDNAESCSQRRLQPGPGARTLERTGPGYVAWALGWIGTVEARMALERRLSTEADYVVRDEIGFALGASLPRS